MIVYIFGTTDEDNLYAIKHSLTSAQTFAMSLEKANYNKKVRTFSYYYFPI